MAVPEEETPLLTGPSTLLSADDTVDVFEAESEPVTTKELFQFASCGTRVVIGVGCVGACIVGGGLPAFTYFFGKLMQEAATQERDEVADKLAYYSLWLFICACGALVAGWVMTTCFLIAGETQVSTIRKKYFESLLSQEPGWFDLQKAGALTQRLHGDSQIVYKGIAEQAGLFFMHTVTILASYTVGFVTSWRLSLVLMSTVPLIIVSGVIMQKVLISMVTNARASYSKAGGVAEETFSSVRTVYSLSAQLSRITQYNTHLLAAFKGSRFQGFSQGAGIGVAFMIFFSTYAIGFYYASYLIRWKLNDIGDVLTAFFSIIIGSFSFAQVGPPIAAFASARGAARRIFSVIDRKPRHHPGTATIDNLKGDITLKNLTFRYPSRTERPVFKHLDMEIKAGETVGLVGLSGCGKSSIVSLLQRFYEPADAEFGMVMLDERVKPYPYESNLELLEARQSGSSQAVEIKLPIVAEGNVVKTCMVSMGSRAPDNSCEMTHLVPDSDGALRTEGPDAWFWVEKESEKEAERVEFKLPLDVCAQLQQAKSTKSGSVTIDLAFGRYEMDVNSMTRRNVPVSVVEEQNGRISVDGQELNSLDLSWWRDQVGMVTQEPVLFVGSIMENVKTGRPAATDEEVHEACKRANIHHTIMRWPEQYNTKVGEGGCQLSGGQKQRIAIARAIVKDPRILLLDEATSALDRESEMKVQGALDAMLSDRAGERKRTTVVIAHRLQTVVKSDKIFVMKPPASGHEEDGGTVAEVGNHEELLALNGIYANLWNAQKRGDEQDEALKNDTGSDAGSEASIDEEDENWELAPVKSAEEQAKEDEQKKKEKIKKNKSLSRVIGLARPDLLWVIPGILGSLLNGAIYPIYAFFFADALDVFQKIHDDENYDRSNIDFWCLMFVVVGLGALVGNVLQFGAFGYMGERLTLRIRKMLFSHMLRQDLAFYDLPEHESGALGMMLSKETEAVHNMFGPFIGTLLRTVCCLTMGFTFAFVANWKLTLVLLSTVPAVGLAGAANMMIMMGGESLDRKGASGRVTSEAISNVKTVVSFNLAKKMVEEYRVATAAVKSNRMKRAWGIGFAFGFSQLSLFSVFALGLWYGGKLMGDDELEYRDLTLVIMSISMSSMGVGETMAMQGTGMDASEASANIFEMLDTEPLVDQMSTAGKRDVLKGGDIGFENVDFAYPTRPNMPVLRNFSMDIKGSQEGMHVGLIGGTGSGKSTVMALLQRFYKLATGKINVDGVDLADVDLQWWRSQVGVVSQEPALFGMTVLQNIRLGKPDATMAEVHEAAKLAHIHRVIEDLPEGYDTEVGTKGSRLSGGQKQRVAIARAILRKPRILLLDEATSALDNECEGEVQRALDNVIAERSMTTITIAHKLSTIRDAQAITVLRKGRLIEQGSHDELMALGGEYASMYMLYHSLEGTAPSPQAQ